MTDWSVFGEDPASGTPDVFETMARALNPVVDTSQSSSDSLRMMALQAGLPTWFGSGATAFAESVSALPADLGEVAAAHQTAISALSNYAETLRSLQQHAAQFLAAAQSAQRDVASALADRAEAAARYSQADQQHYSCEVEGDALEAARVAAAAVGDVATSARLEVEIAAMTQARDIAAAERFAAAADIEAAKSALDCAQAHVADEQANARRIAASRCEAAKILIRHLEQLSEFSIRRRSWIDRVPQDLQSLGSVRGSQILGGSHKGRSGEVGKLLFGPTSLAAETARTVEQGWTTRQGAGWVRGYNVQEQHAGTLGSVPIDAGVAASATVDAQAQSDVSVSRKGLTLGADASVSAEAQAEVRADVGNRYLGATSVASASVGAEAEGDGSVHVGLDGVEAKVGAQAFAAASASEQASVHALGATATARGSVYAGIGIYANADADVTMKDVKMSAHLGAALGLGAGINVSIDVKPLDVIHDLGHIVRL